MIRLKTVFGLTVHSGQHFDYLLDLSGDSILLAAVNNLQIPRGDYDLFIEVPGASHLFYLPSSETLSHVCITSSMVLRVVSVSSVPPFRISLGLSSKIRIPSDFCSFEKLFHSGQTTISRAIEKSTGNVFAIKKYRIVGSRSLPIKSLEREIRISCDVNHPAIISSPLIFHKNDIFSPIFKYYANGSLTRLLHNSITPTQSMIVIYGIASGMTYLHGLRIAHRDLKPANVLISNKLHPKITDFGFSRDVDESLGRWSIIEATIRYMSPEQFDSDAKQNPFLSDVHSFGMLVWAVLAGEEPWSDSFGLMNNIPGIMRRIMNRSWPSLDGLVATNVLKDLIVRCWDLPEKRPTFEEICEILENVECCLEGTEIQKYEDYVRKLKEFGKERKIKVILKLKDREKQEFFCCQMDTFETLGKELGSRARLPAEAFSFYGSGEVDGEMLKGPIWRYRNGQVIHVRVDCRTMRVRFVANNHKRVCEVEMPKIMDVGHIKTILARSWGIEEDSLLIWKTEDDAEGGTALYEIRIDKKQGS
jgi:hypothetical protein